MNSHAPAPVLDLRQIARTYGTPANPLPVLHGVDIRVGRGEYVAIVGPSGSGKSTLLNIIGCLDRPTSGAYYFVGEDIAGFGDDRLSRLRNTQIGFVFQSFQLVPHLSVLENVELPLFYARQARRPRRQRCAELLERVGLGHRVTHIPNELSGGESQRAAIARALVNEPALVLADEPTGNLDSATSAQILALFDELHEGGATIVMITHDLDIARQAPRRIELRDGAVERDTGAATAVVGGAVVILLEMIREALRNLSRHKLRSFLTALGIIFGIASVMAMVSTGEGARRKILEEIGELGIKNIIVSAVKPPDREKVTSDDNAEVLRYGLTFKDLRQIRKTVPLVAQALPVHERKTWVWFKSRRLAASLRGVRKAYLDNLNLEPILGRSLTELDDAERRRVCVVRTRLLRELRYAGDPLQLDLRVGAEIYRVVGVLPDYGFRSMTQTVLGVDDRKFELYAPFDTVVDRLGFNQFEYKGSSYENTRVELHQILCEARSEDEVIEAAKCVQAILAHGHKRKDYQMTVPLEMLVSRQRTRQVFDIVLTIIAGISLVVGGIGILNIMLASVTERTREIGIRRAIGATQLDITTQFLIETVTLAAIGGVLGVALGVAGAMVLGQFTDWQPVITAWAVGISIAISCTTGVVFGMYPARRAAHMNPIEALRHQ